MKQSKSRLHRNEQTGSVLVTVLVIAIIVVLFLMWQTGTFSSTESPSSANTSSTAPAAATQQEVQDVMTPTGTAGTPATESTNGADQQPQGTPLEPLPQTPTGKEPEAISALAEALIAAHPVDMSPCRAAADAVKALECATGIQSTVLADVFQDYEARRAAGDLVARERGGEVLKLVISELNAKLQPFEEATR